MRRWRFSTHGSYPGSETAGRQSGAIGRSY